MIVLQMQGGQLVLRDVERFGGAAAAGLLEGARLGAESLARDVREHTPMKSGRAREAVTVTPSRGGAVQTVAYTGTRNGRIGESRQGDAWYMKFVLLGAKPHVIQPKYTKARSSLRRAQWRALKGGRLAPTFVRKALAFDGGAGETLFRRSVRHPGIRPRRILSERLRASTPTIETALQSAIRRNIERAHASRSSYRGARWTGSGWSHER